MQKIINIIIIAATFIFAAGCSQEKTGPSMDAKGAVVQLSVSAGQMQTKAIDESVVKTIRIFAFDYTGRQVGHVYKSNPASDEKFHMGLSVPGDKAKVNVTFYAIANEGAMYYDDAQVVLSAEMTRAQLDELVYSSLITTVEALPLYGRIEMDLTLTSDLHVEGDHAAFRVAESVSIDLERSLAKIGVYAAAIEGTDVDPVIHSITLASSGRRDVSYLFPASDDSSLKIRDAGIVSLSEDRVFSHEATSRDRLSNSGTVAKRLSVQNTDKDITVTDYYTEVLAPFYLAEVPYGSSSWDTPADPSGRPVTLVIEYSLGASTLMDYAVINMPAIERNSFYQVRCLIKSEGHIEVSVDVAPWKEGEDNELDFSFPTHNNPLFKTGDDYLNESYSHIYKTPATMYWSGTVDTPSEAGAFSVDFNMSYPVGGIWRPVIRGATDNDYEIRLYKKGETVPLANQSVHVTDAADQWYTIKVVPLESENEGKKVVLSVSYTTSFLGGDYSYLLQINGGEENNLAWTEYDPMTGDEFEASTVDIVITQVEP